MGFSCFRIFPITFCRFTVMGFSCFPAFPITFYCFTVMGFSCFPAFPITFCCFTVMGFTCFRIFPITFCCFSVMGFTCFRIFPITTNSIILYYILGNNCFISNYFDCIASRTLQGTQKPSTLLHLVFCFMFFSFMYPQNFIQRFFIFF